MESFNRLQLKVISGADDILALAAICGRSR